MRPPHWCFGYSTRRHGPISIGWPTFNEPPASTVWLQTGGPATVQPLAAVHETLADPAPLTYELDAFGLRFEFQPVDFIQINRAINAALVATAINALELDSAVRVLDLYAGIGNFSLPIARRAGAVVGVEGLASLTDRARRNAALNQLDNVAFETADLDAVTGAEDWFQPPPDRVLLDPARAGAQALMPILGQLAPRRIVYVSCHPGTLARDVGMLVNEFGYRLVEARIADMFPHTAHVESIAVLDCSS